jgi:hypothetical protein
VEGQVIAADTGRPLPGVKVTRGKTGRDPQAGWPPKGGELMMRKPPSLTDAEGRFRLASERVLSIVRGAGWNDIRLIFELASYQRLQTNYSGNLATNDAGGEPLLDAGVVCLRPAQRALDGGH